jgi:DNA-binding transcriptional ArsR family regulator
MDKKNQHTSEAGRLMPEIAELFKVLGDPTRLRIIEALDGTECCVQELEELLDMSQSAVSHQLHTLRLARLVRLRREGKNRTTPWTMSMSTDLQNRAEHVQIDRPYERHKNQHQNVRARRNVWKGKDTRVLSVRIADRSRRHPVPAGGRCRYGYWEVWRQREHYCCRSGRHRVSSFM